MRIVSVVLVILAGMVLATGVSAATILNGSFEEGDTNWVSASKTFQTLPNATYSLPSWSVGGNGVDWVHKSLWDAAQGDFSLDLSAASSGLTSQSFSTVAGQRYYVEFSLSGNPAGTQGVKDLRVIASTTSPASSVSADYTFDTRGRGFRDMGWTVERFEFVAAGTPTSITFQSFTNTPYGPALDKISVGEVLSNQGTTVPVPAAAWLGLAMMGGLGLIRRHRRRSL